jgi:phytoene/squalene synthetase
MPTTPESHPARYLALLYCPASQRLALDALFGIEREVSDSLRPGLDHHVAHSRLQWWREESQRAADGRPVHPLTRALVDAVGGSAGAVTSAESAESRSGSAGSAGSAGSRSGSAGSAESTGWGSATEAAPNGARSTGATPFSNAATRDDAQVGLSAAAQAQLRARSVPQLAGLSGFVDVAVWDLAGATFETRRELTAYCERWAAAMIEPLVPRDVRVLSQAAGVGPRAADVGPSTTVLPSAIAEPPTATLVSAPTPPSDAAAPPGSDTRVNNWRALGAAMREIELLADLGREAHYGRLRVPLDELESAKADPSALAKPPWPAAVGDLLRARHKTLRDEITRALGDVDRVQQPALRGLLVWAALAWRLSQRAERALPDQLRPGGLDAIADAWFAWRIARRATIGRFRLN